MGKETSKVEGILLVAVIARDQASVGVAGVQAAGQNLVLVQSGSSGAWLERK